MLRTPDQQVKDVVREFRRALDEAERLGTEAAMANVAAKQAGLLVTRSKFDAESRLGGMLLAIRQKSGPLPDYGPITADSGTQYRRRDGVLEWYDPAQSTLEADVWVTVPAFLVEDLERLVELRDVVAT